MAIKKTSVVLHYCSGKVVYDDVEVLYDTKDGIKFRRRVEYEESVTTTDYTSNLSYLIAEYTVEPKKLKKA